MADLGLSHIPGFRDPTARAFLSEKGKKSLEKTEALARSGKRSMRLEAARSMADLIGLRTVAIDAAVRDAITLGARQLVILGAGYDGRAWRMTELEGMRTYEVDRPATQNEKRARVAQLPDAIANVTFVSIDFEHESLDAVLARAGHNASAPTCWIWEGVVMYLTRDAMHGTLANIAQRSAPGSTLIINYHTAHRRFIARLIFSLIGEPQISAWTREEMAAELASVGFRVHDDSGMLDWNVQYAQSQATVQRGAYMRIVVARK